MGVLDTKLCCTSLCSDLSTDLLLGSLSEGSEPTTEDMTITCSALSNWLAMCPVYNDVYKYFLYFLRWCIWMRLELFHLHPDCKLKNSHHLHCCEQQWDGSDWPIFTHVLSFKNVLIRTDTQTIYSTSSVQQWSCWNNFLASSEWQCYLGVPVLQTLTGSRSWANKDYFCWTQWPS